MNVSDALVDYLASIKHLAPGSQQVYQQHLKVFAEWTSLQGVCLEQVNNRQVQAFLAWLSTSHKPHKRGKVQLSTHTIAAYLRNIWTFLYWCLEDEEYQQYVRYQTVKGIKMPRREQFVKEVFTDEEIEALFTACQHESKPPEYQLRDTAILAVLLDTGIRAAELRTLTIGNVTLARDIKEDSYITVMGKGSKQREIPLGNKSRRALNRYIRDYRHGAKKSDPVFLSRHGGVLAHEAFKDILLRLKELSRLPDDAQVNPHKFRHTFATRFMSNGGDVYDLSRLMGHSSVATTEGYLKSLSAKAVRTRKKHVSVLDSL
jgi:site-specific recombinase XerD